MGSAEADSQEGASSVWRRWLIRAGWVVLVAVLGALAILWSSRQQIATNLIDDYLAETGLQASYDIASIGPKWQMIENVVIGDPAAPDLTIDRVTVDIAYGLGSPSISAAILDSPRLFATYRDGEISLGALDPLLFAESEDAAGLPSIDLTIRQGAALLETDFGDVGVSLKGSGPLDDGFSGTIGLVAPSLGVEGCRASESTAYGEVLTSDGAPRFRIPVKLAKVDCAGADVSSAILDLDLALDSAFSKISGDIGVETGTLALGDVQAASLSGTAKLSANAELFVLDHDVGLGDIGNGYASVGALRFDGALRSADGFSQTSWNAAVEGDDVAMAGDAVQSLGDAAKASEGTLLAPLLAKIERNLAPASRSASLRAKVNARLDDAAYSFVIPEARLRSESGETLAALSRLSLSRPEGARSLRMTGNVLTGGSGLPQITGRLEKQEGQALVARLTMPEYSDGEDRIALPQIVLRQTASGGFVFSGKAIASGALPDGSTRNLQVPLNGRYDSRSGLSLGTRCENIRFDSLVYSKLSLKAQVVEVCPDGQEAMVRYGKALSVAVALSDVALDAEISDSPSRFEASRASLRYPGGFEVDDVAARIGPTDNAVRLTSARVEGELGEEIKGTFSQATAKLDAVPLDASDLEGKWSYADGVLRLEDARLSVSDRTDGIARFEPLVSENAVLTFDGSDITALASLQHPASGSKVLDTRVDHNLAGESGSAILTVDALEFGPSLSLADLTFLAVGVVAYTDGTITGDGRVDWSPDTVTSTGTLKTVGEEGLSLAAAFGPVNAMRGEIRFTDLLNLTTAPSQVIEIGSINPGIEALDGTVRFSMTGGEVIEVEDARWPFMGGQLIMQPTKLIYGTESEQRYTFEVTDLDAAKFVAQMEMTNLGATGTFNGRVPVIFDAEGNGRIEGGMLTSEDTGGNVSYIGELSYEDMGAISNFAFNSLRSLDYRRMSVALEGDLAGEIITRFSIDGVRQGETASQNFITRRLAKLPIRFNVNVRSENFYELATMVRTFYDPDALPDPVDQGVMNSDGTLVVPLSVPPPVPGEPKETPDSAPVPDAVRPDESGVQPPESETLP